MGVRENGCLADPRGCLCISLPKGIVAKGTEVGTSGSAFTSGHDPLFVGWLRARQCRLKADLEGFCHVTTVSPEQSSGAPTPACWTIRARPLRPTIDLRLPPGAYRP